MTEKVPRQLLFSHIRLVVISEETARDGLGKPLDFLSRNAAMRTDFYLVIAKQASAESILQVVSRIDPIPANNLYAMLQTSDKLWAAASKITLEKLIKELAAPGKNPTITGVEIVGHTVNEDKMSESQKIDPPTEMKFSGVAVFREDRLVGWLGEQETKAVKYLLNTVKNTVGVLKCPNQDKEELTIDVYHVKSKIVVSIVDDKPVFDINVRVEADITDIECKLDMTSPGIIKQLEQEGDEKLKEIITSSIKKVQKEMGADIFGFGDALHQAYPKFWRRYEDWNETFKNVEVRVNTENIIRRIGTMNQPVDTQTRR
jgi:spore germination protein KC